MSAAVEFNAQVFVSEQLNRQLINTTQDVAIRCVQVLAEKFNFDAEEAILMLGLNMIKLERKAPAGVKGVKVAKTAKVQAPKSAFPLPYNGEFNDACCYALRQNNGLFTQCTGTRKGEAHFCKGCASQMQKMGAEMPEYGTIQQRMAVGIFEYVDPKGRKPIAYAKIMKKYKLTEEQVLEEAGKLNMVINEEHFAAPEETKRGRPKSEKALAEQKKEKGQKGRPKKSKKVLQIEGEDEDLFAALIAEQNNKDDTEEENVAAGKKKAGRNAGALGKSEEEKEAERLAKEQEKKEKEAKRLAEKAEKEAKLAAEKAEKEAKKKAEEEARAAKKAAEEAEKQAKKEAAEKAKAEKEAKLAAEKEAKKKSGKKGEGKSVKDEEEDAEPDVVKKIEFEGKKYLKSKKTGIIYDYNKYAKEGEQVVIGKWSESSNKIIFDDAEESEDEYDM
jgi:hypothetical protein